MRNSYIYDISIDNPIGVTVNNEKHNGIQQNVYTNGADSVSVNTVNTTIESNSENDQNALSSKLNIYGYKIVEPGKLLMLLSFTLKQAQMMDSSLLILILLTT